MRGSRLIEKRDGHWGKRGRVSRVAGQRQLREERSRRIEIPGNLSRFLELVVSSGILRSRFPWTLAAPVPTGPDLALPTLPPPRRSFFARVFSKICPFHSRDLGEGRACQVDGIGQPILCGRRINLLAKKSLASGRDFSGAKSRAVYLS